MKKPTGWLRPRAVIVFTTCIAVVVGLAVTMAGCATWTGRGSLEFVGNVWPSGVAEDPDFLLYWNQVTPENAAKWGNAEPSRDEMVWDDLDIAYDFALANDLPFRIHTLVWGRSQPPWLGRLSDEELRAELEEWISLLGERYPETDMIDVVNEPLHVQPPYMWALGGPGETRFDWIVAVFELARESFPNAELTLNDFGILESEEATAGYLRIVATLKERDLIDAIGVQAHDLEDVPTETIAANLDRLAEANLPIYVTELDLALEDDAEQAARMEELVTLFAAHRAVRGITLWGYKEEWIYSKSAHLLSADGEERPALTWLREFRGR